MKDGYTRTDFFKTVGAIGAGITGLMFAGASPVKAQETYQVGPHTHSPESLRIKIAHARNLVQKNYDEKSEKHFLEDHKAIESTKTVKQGGHDVVLTDIDCPGYDNDIRLPYFEIHKKATEYLHGIIIADWKADGLNNRTKSGSPYHPGAVESSIEFNFVCETVLDKESGKSIPAKNARYVTTLPLVNYPSDLYAHQMQENPVIVLGEKEIVKLDEMYEAFLDKLLASKELQKPGKKPEKSRISDLEIILGR